MTFNDHSSLKDKHAFLGASKHSWVNYSIDKLVETYKNHVMAEEGTILHDFAKKCIELNQKLTPIKKTINMYVNDAISFKMKPEQILYYSDNSFGTADAICYRNGKLMIFDLKTGITPASFKQLEIYDALFCLEYKYKPHNIEIENRIYQLDNVEVNSPDPDWIKKIMDTIIIFDKEIEKIKSGGV